jgi:nitroreductase
MDVIECIKTRRDIREFEDRNVDDELIEKILEAGINAPSAGNVQDWEFVVVKREDFKELLCDAALGQEFIKEAPIVIVVCSNLRKIHEKYGERGVSLYSIQDTAAAIENILLAAWSLGLGACWVGAFNEEKVRQILYLPEHVRPLAILPLGYPKKPLPQKPKRMHLHEVLHFERF